MYPIPLNPLLVRTSVVRLYRNSADGVAGVIEDVESGTSTPFRTVEELWKALREPSETAR